MKVYLEQIPPKCPESAKMLKAMCTVFCKWSGVKMTS